MKVTVIFIDGSQRSERFNHEHEAQHFMEEIEYKFVHSRKSPLIEKMVVEMSYLKGMKES